MRVVYRSLEERQYILVDRQRGRCERCAHDVIAVHAKAVEIGGAIFVWCVPCVRRFETLAREAIRRGPIT